MLDLAAGLAEMVGAVDYLSNSSLSESPLGSFTSDIVDRVGILYEKRRTAVRS
jgi:hypothetical protein